MVTIINSVDFSVEDLAARKIQSFWRERVVWRQSVVARWDQHRVDRWLRTYQNDWAAHAVWRDNQQILLQNGVLRSSEEILRLTGRVSSETGVYGYRDISTLPLPTDRPDLVDRVLAVADQILPRVLFAENDVHRLFDKILIKEGVRATLNKFQGWMRNQLSYDWHMSSVLDDSLLSIPEIPYQPKRDIFIDMVAASSNRNIDSILAHDPHAQYFSMEDKYSIRNGAIASSYLSPTVRFAKPGSIEWGYGSVVILRGGTKTFGSAYQCLPGEFIARAPFENGGRFFSFVLDDPETLILAPRNIAEQYRERYNICPIEHLSAAQVTFFQVPPALRTNI